MTCLVENQAVMIIWKWGFAKQSHKAKFCLKWGFPKRILSYLWDNYSFSTWNNFAFFTQGKKAVKVNCTVYVPFNIDLFQYFLSNGKSNLNENKLLFVFFQFITIFSIIIDFMGFNQSSVWASWCHSLKVWTDNISIVR